MQHFSESFCAPLHTSKCIIISNSIATSSARLISTSNDPSWNAPSCASLYRSQSTPLDVPSDEPLVVSSNALPNVIYNCTVKCNVKCILFVIFFCIFNGFLKWTLRCTLKLQHLVHHKFYPPSAPSDPPLGELSCVLLRINEYINKRNTSATQVQPQLHS